MAPPYTIGNEGMHSWDPVKLLKEPSLTRNFYLVLDLVSLTTTTTGQSTATTTTTEGTTASENKKEVLEYNKVTKQEIEKAKRLKSFIFHPDKSRGDPKAPLMLHLINLAAETLLDPEKRVAYDMMMALLVRREKQLKGMEGKRGEMRVELERREREAMNAAFNGGGQSQGMQGKSKEEWEREERGRLKRKAEDDMKARQEIQRQTKISSLSQSLLSKQQPPASSQSTSTISKEEEFQRQQDTIIKLHFQPSSTVIDKPHLLNIFTKYGPLLLVKVNAAKGRASLVFGERRDALKAMEGVELQGGGMFGKVESQASGGIEGLRERIRLEEGGGKPLPQPILQPTIPPPMPNLQSSTKGTSSSSGGASGEYERQTLRRLVAEQAERDRALGGGGEELKE